MIEIRHLSFQRGSRSILKDMTISVGEGVTGIIGPNGCGKTTLLSHISRRLPSKNRIFIDGRPIETIDRREYARKVAVMSQNEDSMADELTAGYLVLTGRYPYKKLGMGYTEKDRAIASEMMKKQGVYDLRYKELGQLSGGECQRVWLAKAMAQEPEILLLDEPTNHLDVKYRLHLMEELPDFPGTVMIVLHDISLALRYCSHLVIMKEGKIVASGKTEETASREILEDVFEVPFYTVNGKDGEFFCC